MTATLTVDSLPLDRIHPNPYQPRTADDPAHVAALAEDILERGLLQVPTARPHPDQPGHVQLAFGHSRLAALQLLAGNANGQGAAWRTMSVTVRELSDREMSDLAAAENARRKNLTPIEIARAIERRMKDFKLTQAEAGEPFGLSQSAAAHALRLLRLPDPVREAVDRGEIPERLARQLVTVTPLAAKQVESLAKAIAKAAPADRDDVTADGLDEILSRQGRNVGNVEWPADWLKTPEPVAQAAGELTELRACFGCPHLFKREGSEYCTLPPCFDLKEQKWFAKTAGHLSARLGLPVVGEKEKVHSLGLDYDRNDLLRPLIGAGAKDPGLGLRLCAPFKNDHTWYFRIVLQTESVSIGTAAPAAVKAWLAAAQKSKSSGKSGAAVKNLKADPKAEEKARAERRRLKATALQVEHDMSWLLAQASEWMAKQLTISGGILAYFDEERLPQIGYSARELPLLMTLEEQLQTEIERAEGKAQEVLRRRHVALRLLFEHAVAYQVAKKTPQEWKAMQDAVRGLATTGALGRNNCTGLGLKLPAGWNKPPIHHTAYNCWHCGAFTAQKRLSKRDLEVGWKAVIYRGTIVDVSCPDCAGKK